MNQETPRRFERNVPGPFYTTGDCLACAAPEYEAPDLLAPLEGGNHDTYFVRQPETPEEVEKACRALEVCCVAALRYEGPTRRSSAASATTLSTAITCCRAARSRARTGWPRDGGGAPGSKETLVAVLAAGKLNKGAGAT